MGGEIIIVSFLLMVVGPLIGLVLGGFYKGVKWARMVAMFISLLATEPIIVGLIRGFQWKYVPVALFVAAINISMIMIPFYFFKKMLVVQKRPGKGDYNK